MDRPFLRLPSHCRDMVLDFVDSRDACRMDAVCVAWKALMRSWARRSARPDGTWILHRAPVPRAPRDPSLHYYEYNADSIIAASRACDLSSLHATFLAQLLEGARILDLGCGAGRDMRAFLDLGFSVEGLDGCARMVEAAREYTGATVHHQLIQRPSLPVAAFDAVWACASLIHVPLSQLPDALRRIGRCMRIGGVLYASFLDGEGTWWMPDGRCMTHLAPDALRDLFAGVPQFSVKRVWTTPDAMGREDRSWTNVLAVLRDFVWLRQ